MTIGNPAPSINPETGAVTNHGEVTPISNGGSTTLSGVQIGETGSSQFTYTVNYNKGTIEEGSNVRIDTVTNSRPGILIKKTKWDGQTPVEGAAFELKNENNETVGIFTSDAEGLITEAFLRKNIKYYLRETETPAGYQGIDQTMEITLSDDDKITIGGVDAQYYSLEDTGEQKTIIIKNRTFGLQAIKKESINHNPMSGVKFALHKQFTVDNVTQISPTPLVGYEELVTDKDGIIPKIDGTLPPGTYELREKETNTGYKVLSGYIDFTISNTGFISLVNTQKEVTLTGITDVETGKIQYTLEILNTLTRDVSFKKVDISDVENSALSGAEFDLYETTRVDGKDVRKEPAIYTELTSGEDGILATIEGVKVFELPVGTYYLVETKAPTAYYLKTEPIIVNITVDGINYNEGTILSSGGSGISYDDKTQVYTLKISNLTGYELPSTGGPGTMLIHAFGIVLAGLAGTCLSLKKRKRR